MDIQKWRIRTLMYKVVHQCTYVYIQSHILTLHYACSFIVLRIFSRQFDVGAYNISHNSSYSGNMSPDLSASGQSSQSISAQPNFVIFLQNCSNVNLVFIIISSMCTEICALRKRWCKYVLNRIPMNTL